jgi:hypothetical protein
LEGSSKKEKKKFEGKSCRGHGLKMGGRITEDGDRSANKKS